jgi:ankyrin repeat protein
LYFEIGEWDSHETLIHCIVSLKKNKNLQLMLRAVLTEHPQHFKELVNLPTSDGETPVITAVLNSSIECLNTLLNSGGIDIELKDDRGLTAESHAEK